MDGNNIYGAGWIVLCSTVRLSPGRKGKPQLRTVLADKVRAAEGNRSGGKIK